MAGGRGRVLVVDPAPGEPSFGELDAFDGLGLVPTVNLRRVSDPTVAARLRDRWPTVDFDGFSERELAEHVEGYDALKCRGGIPLTRAVLERATSGRGRRLVLAGRAASGTDTFDLAAAERSASPSARRRARTRRRWPS